MNDGQLSAHIEQALTTSRAIMKATDKLGKRVQDACEQVDNVVTIPGLRSDTADLDTPLGTVKSLSRPALVLARAVEELAG